jgi:PAS domain S-box-containing protein
MALLDGEGTAGVNNGAAFLDPLRKKASVYLRATKVSLPLRPTPLKTELASIPAQRHGRAAENRIRALLVFAAAYIVAWSYLFVATFLGAHPPPAPLFPPEAVLISALLLTSPRRWWQYLIAAFLIQVPILAYVHVPLGWNLLGYTPDAIEPIVAVSLMRLFIPVPPRFASQREVSIYAACVVGAATIGATVGSLVNASMGGEPFLTSWRTWFLSDTLANLILAPTIILWITAGMGGLRSRSSWRYVEATLLFGGILVLGGAAFIVRFQGPGTTRALAYLPVPLLLWAAVRFGPRGITSALSLTAILAVPAVASELGPFASRAVPDLSTLGNVFMLQVFLLVIGVPLLFLAALVDERKLTALALESSELRFRAAFESAATGMMLVDPTGRILQVNRPVIQMLGYSEEELRTHTFMQLTYPEDLESNLTLLQQALAGETDSYQMEKRYLHKSGSIVWGRVSAGVVRDAAGNLIYLIGQLEDITARKRLEQEREEARANALALRETKAQMDTFLGIASHELKTPLTSLKLSLQLAQRQLRKLTQGPNRATAEADVGLRSAAEQLERTAHQMQRLEALVNDLVDVSRIQAGKLELRPEQVDLVAVVQDAVTAQQEAAPERRIDLQRPVDLSVPVYADAGRIEQVVTNYLTNALKYSPADRPVEVGIKVEMEPQHVRVWVRDFGQGLPLFEQEHIWERFHRVQGVEVQSGTGVGLGLGLFVSRTIVERHHGQVGVQSSPGQGSTFWFILPLAPH